jgi:peroxiredoxin
VPTLLLILRVVLVAVLAVAGVAKLADRGGAVGAVKGFGVPERLAATVARVLPVAELAAAVLLIPSSSAGVGAAVALALMLIFCAAITRSLLRGEAPDCHCFGAIHSEPAGPRTLIRNLVLAAAAGVVLAGGPGVSATGWVGSVHAGGATVVALGVALAAALVGGGLLVLNLLRRNGELLLRVDELEDALTASGLIVPEAQTPVATGGLPIGTPAPDFELPGLDGTPVSLDTLRGNDSDELLLVFSDPDCGPCSALMPQVAEWQRERPGGRRLVLISRGAPEANLAHAREHGLTGMLLQSDREVAESFAVSATPSALVVAADGTVASAVHAGEEQIRALVDGPGDTVVLPVHAGLGQQGPEPASAGQAGSDSAGVGQPAPDPAIRTLEGKIVPLSQRLADDGGLLVFWNPDCGFCERMVDSLRELDAREPGLVLISTGSPAANRELGLRAPILLDDGFAAGNAFGAMGTPSAVRIDSDRRVASALAVGADAVLALAGAEPVPA